MALLFLAQLLLGCFLSLHGLHLSLEALFRLFALLRRGFFLFPISLLCLFLVLGWFPISLHVLLLFSLGEKVLVKPPLLLINLLKGLLGLLVGQLLKLLELLLPRIFVLLLAILLALPESLVMPIDVALETVAAAMTASWLEVFAHFLCNVLFRF